MGRSNHIRLDEIESVFRLVQECRELWADADAWQMHLLHGACHLTGTAVAHYNEQRLAPDLRATEILDETDCGWRDPAARISYMRLYTDVTDRPAYFPRATRLAVSSPGSTGHRSSPATP